MSESYRIVIPARYASSRFPGKVLAPIAGRPMLAHTWQVALATTAAEIIVATDDVRIEQFCQAEGMLAQLTKRMSTSACTRTAVVSCDNTRSCIRDGSEFSGITSDTHCLQEARVLM